MPPPRPRLTPLERRLGLLACALLVGTPTPTPAGAETLATAVASAEAAWAQRGEGHHGAVADRAPVDQAIAHYEAALTIDPENLELRWKLLRALHFAGDFATTAENRDAESFDRARQVSEEGIEVLTAKLGTGDRPEELEAEALRQALAAAGASTVDVSRFYFWSAVGWGAWGREAGIVGAVRKGVAGRMLRYTQVGEKLDPSLDEGGVYRVLSTLHRTLPRIPFMTGWVDRDQALALIERAVEIAPDNPGNRFLLAETLLDLEIESRRFEALALLREIAQMEPTPDRVVEDLRIREQARERLAAEVGELTEGVIVGPGRRAPRDPTAPAPVAPVAPLAPAGSRG
ncbi:MAG: hypothetical protein QNK04_13040 [Myxococcota bacterium]|nr:hypothetical protein [Myxococcota bacterium]